MAIELTYDKQLKFLLARVHGYLSFEDIQDFMSEVLSSEDIPSDANALWDITEMEFDNIDIDLQTKIARRLGRMFFMKPNIYMIIKLLGFVPQPNLRYF